MVVLFSHLLDARAVKFHPLLFTQSVKTQPADEPYTRQEMIDMFITQVGDFKRKRVKKRARNDEEHDNYTETFSGKAGGKFDDICMAALINYVGKVIYSQKYTELYKDRPPLWQP